jgi:hypothetical protein
MARYVYRRRFDRQAIRHSVLALIAISGALAGSAAGTSTVIGDLRGAGKLVGTADGTSTVTGTLRGAGALAGTAAGMSTVVGAISSTSAIAGTADGTSTVVGAIKGAGALAGSAAGTSTVIGDLRGAGKLVGTADGTSTVIGDLRGAGKLVGTADGTSTVTGTLRGAGALAGTITGTSTVVGYLSSVIVPFIGERYLEFGHSLRTGVRALLYDASGAPVAEISPQIESVLWRLAGPGSAKFRLAYRDAACKKSWLLPGRRVMFQFENGLPDWGGVIEFPLTQDSSGVIVSAFTAEKILEQRRTAKTAVFDNQTPGAICQAMIEAANAIAPTGIVVGTFYAGGSPVSLEYHLQNVLEQIKELVRLSGNDFSIIPTISAGVLTFTANWYEERGEDKSNQVMLVENRNAQISSLDWQGPVYNRITLAGEGSAWDDARMTVTEEDVTSQGSYGLREYSEVQSGKVSEATLTANANALVTLYSQPKKRITVVAMDRAPGEFANYDIGDVVRVRAFQSWADWVLDDTFRVIAREWKPGNLCTLEVEEWQA